MQVEVVENPRRRHRRRKMSPLQKMYFGGGRRSHRRRRRNPDLMMLGNPRRRHVRRHGQRYLEVPLGRRRRRNPGLGLGNIGQMFDLKSMLLVGAGIFGSKGLPAVIQKKIWAGMPVDGVAGYAVRVGVTFALSEVVRMLTKSRQNAQYIVTGGMAAIAYDIIAQNIAPMIGLTGLGGLGQGDYVTEEELRDALGAYVTGPFADVSSYFDEQNAIKGLGRYIPAYDGMVA